MLVRQLNTYAIAKEPVDLEVRQILAYAVVRVSPANFTLSGKENILALINKNSVIGPLTEAQISIAPPQPSSLQNTNSKVRVRGKFGFPYSGSIDLHYSRLEITEAFEGPEDYTPVPGSLHEQLDSINQTFGLALTTDDVVDVQASGSTISVEAASTSYLFVPGSKVVLGSVPDLSIAMINKDFSGFVPES